MASNITKAEGYVSRTDLFKIDPRKIRIREGWNPRQTFELDELKTSICDNGFFNNKPLLLAKKGTELYLVDGERRLRAVLELLDEGVPIVAIPAVLDVSQDEGVLLARALSANNNAEPLDQYEEAQGFQRLIGYGWSIARIAQEVGKSSSHVSGRLLLLEASSEVKQAVVDRRIMPSDAVRVVRESNKKGEKQEVTLARKVSERATKKAAPTLTVVRGGGGSDEDDLVKLVHMRGLPWVIRCLLEMDYTAEELITAVEIAQHG